MNLNKTAELSAHSKNISQMFDKISRRYDFLNRLLSFRQDVKWRRIMIHRLPQALPPSQGVLVDVATGTGDVVFQTSKLRPDYKEFWGIDISPGMLQVAEQRKGTEFEGLSHKAVEFRWGSAEDVPLQSDLADALTISFGLRNVDDRNKALADFLRVLKPSGKLLVLEFFEPSQKWMGILFHMYFHYILPVIGGIFSDKKAYQYLPNSVKSMPSGNQFKSQMENLGFGQVKETRFLFGAVRLFEASKK
jgi:demethylmenaquinone methyltransferase/2-methoxy-6-polyprenyl-1,4-benzoquinol methylase